MHLVCYFSLLPLFVYFLRHLPYFAKRGSISHKPLFILVIFLFFFTDFESPRLEVIYKGIKRVTVSDVANTSAA